MHSIFRLIKKAACKIYLSWMRWRYPLTVYESDNANQKASLIICRRHHRTLTPLLMQWASKCETYSPQQIENNPNLIQDILQQCHANPQMRRVLFVEENGQSSSPLGLAKFNDEMVQLAADIANINTDNQPAAFVPAYMIEDRASFGRRHISVHFGTPYPMPSANTPLPQLHQTIRAGLESVATKSEAGNITRAMMRWGNRAGWGSILFAEKDGVRISYLAILRAAWALGDVIVAKHPNEKRIGIMLPSSAGAAVFFYTLIMRGYIPVMLNPLGGERNLISACRTAQVQSVYTARKLLKMSPLAEQSTAALNAADINTTCLEDMRPQITAKMKIKALIASAFPSIFISHLSGAHANRNDEAVVLFTSGSEGAPKGVALSHQNLMINAAQILSRLGYLRGRKMMNALPIFHSFGLLAGVVLPPAAGILAIQYPSPLHYKQIPQVIGDFAAEIFFSADSFLAQYGRYAAPLDLASLRIVYAGAEKLKESTRNLWAEKFGVRIMEGYGVTEMSPAASINTAADNKPNTVGRALSGIDVHLRQTSDIEEGGVLMARGENVMLGYFYADAPGKLVPPPDGVHDTGDIATIDDEGYIKIIGRARRFIKVSGEMVPLDAVEEFIADKWQDFMVAVISIADQTRGEKLIALTDNKTLTREMVAEAMRESGLPSFWIPRQVLVVDEVPQLPTGKLNYPAATAIAKEREDSN